MVPCPFFSHRSKKQFHACGVFRKKVTVVKGSCLQAAEIEISQFEQRENIKFCQKLGKSASKTFQMIKRAYSEEALGHSALFKWHKSFAQGRDSLEDNEYTSQPRTVRIELEIHVTKC
jgi:hypothetical protein